ncbi:MULTISPECIES: FAD-dependent oxidoreductase [unclassified Undibacterium]|uniref:FAD-dependent oxidoreductase n=1 Tax=unclassified Undibacterium TaxID=2630295 RepID=UPI002AC8F93A|nr:MULTISPECIES: FAD-dependent oxidoreductase [unclassified Undibacterium]MEB0138195.1 FAD-dependent oxidoreductase [Undibacterium sp. CCC2.1]MEB0171050.1 FAD-dependent oxidoreductase [Undibacterium sp. CCC1.1]MEB0175095.1 FAD-dependent oxidoreductase [Undibacterium sp. CCC3.4]MEB0214321.1 FAD-dependent oxidoreductase [Undibacterium sp. 5I2]WPX41902.1 FAD-dependent oxidoreductase [Undibacterium sp. CCC3.4]
MKPIALIGSGLAAYTVAREFRKLDKTTPLLIITADAGDFYSKPMLSNAFAQAKTAAMLRNQSALQMAEQLNATILTGTEVLRIDETSNSLVTAAGAFEFSQLVLAVGAQAIRLPIAGTAAAEVLSVNTLADYARLREQVEAVGPAARIAILGAGLIGCEFADDLSGAGYRITLIDPNARPLAALASEPVSLALRVALEARGVTLQMGTSATAVDRDGHGLCVTLANGDVIDADLVLSAVGLRADLRLAATSQLACDRGILVDAFGRTSNAQIFALGDCAQYTLPDGSRSTLPYVAPLMAAARAIAASLGGSLTPIEFKAAPVLVKTPSFPLALLPPGIGSKGSWQTEVVNMATVSRYFDEAGSLRGFAVGPQDAKWRQSLLAEVAMAAAS